MVDADEFGQIELTMDVQTLIDRGHSNAEILDKLDLDSDDEDFIDYLRKREGSAALASDC